MMTPQYLEAIASILSALAWPLVVIAFVLTQRGALTRLLDRLRRLGTPNVTAEFGETVEEVSEQVLNAGLRASTPPTEKQVLAAERVEQAARQSDISVVRAQVFQLAQEYEQIRATMPKGDTRTRRMEVVITKMRTLALAAYPLLQELTNSGSPGERLTAVAILQVRPNPDYLDWLARRLAEEKPFIGYHAGVALLVAVRNLDTSDYGTKLQQAIQKARESVAWKKDTDRYRVLSDAEKELREQP